MKIPILSSWIESQTTKRLKEIDAELKRFSEEARDVILSADTLLDAMAKQRILLLRQKRKPIAIFISTSVLENIVSKVSVPFHARWHAICSGKTSVTDIAKIPVYVNSLLKDAPLLVVGSIIWKSEVNNDK